MALVDYFLKFDGIDGESQDKTHKNEVQILSFTWGETQAGTMGLGGGGGAGKVAFQDVHVRKYVDKASPKLLLCCASGSHIKNAILTARKAGKDQQDYLKITFTDLLVSSYQFGGLAESSVVPTEEVTLNFTKVEMEYKEQKPDGTLGGAVKAHYNIKEMTGG